MTVDEFLTWNAPGPNRWQLLDGEPTAVAPTTGLHGLVQAELAAILRNHLLDSQSRCRAVTAPGVVPRAQSKMNFRIPDLAVVCPEPQQGGASAPVILVEIFSPSNEDETRRNVWAYTTIPTVQQILIVHTDQVGAELLARRPDGDWPADPAILEPGSILQLQSIGFDVPLAALYRTTDLAA